MVTLNEILNGCKKSYLAWLQKQVDSDNILWFTGRIYSTSSGEEDKARKGAYEGSVANPTIFYDKKKDVIKFFLRVHRRCDKFNFGFYFNDFPRNELQSYCNNQGWQLEVSYDRSAICDLVTIFGTYQAFEQSEWHKEYLATVREKKENDERLKEQHDQCCVKTREKLYELMPVVKRIRNATIFDSLINRIAKKESEVHRRFFRSPSVESKVSSKGLYFYEKYSSPIQSSIAKVFFEEIGYKDIQIDDELIAFCFAYYCYEKDINLDDINLELIDWACWICEEDGEKKINFPLQLREETCEKSKEILKSLFD